MWMLWALAYCFVGGCALVYLRSHTEMERFGDALEGISDWGDVGSVFLVFLLAPAVWPLWFPIFGSASLIEWAIAEVPDVWATFRRWQIRRAAFRAADGRNPYKQALGDSF